MEFYILFTFLFLNTAAAIAAIVLHLKRDQPSIKIHLEVRNEQPGYFMDDDDDGGGEEAGPKTDDEPWLESLRNDD